MKRTLVLAVDRDDDFGVKGSVVTPVIGIDNCLSAANALGISDPEDSDINALYAGISTCLELQEGGIDAEVALICGNEKVGHRSDLELVSQLEAVLDTIKPDNVVLIDDGAEDEYIYPIISSRAHVDSVRKVYVKQAPNIEGSFYVITKMLSEPNKRKRFIAPIGALIFVISLFLLLPDLVVMITSGDITMMPSISRGLVLMLVGLFILMYAFNFSNRVEVFKDRVKTSILGRGTMLVMTSLSIGVFIISAIACYYEVKDTYYPSFLAGVAGYMILMIWPSCIALMIYIFGQMLDDVQEESIVRISYFFDCFSIASLGLAMTGLFDLGLTYLNPGYDGTFGIFEIALGVALSFVGSFIKKQYRNKSAIVE